MFDCIPYDIFGSCWNGLNGFILGDTYDILGSSWNGVIMGDIPLFLKYMSLKVNALGLKDQHVIGILNQ